MLRTHAAAARRRPPTTRKRMLLIDCVDCVRITQISNHEYRVRVREYRMVLVMANFSKLREKLALTTMC